ncbi:MAG: aspartate--ammonia ligase [Brevinema sp.]
MMYQSKLTVFETEQAIQSLKMFFEEELSRSLHLQRVSAPLFLESHTGLNDILPISAKPVSFIINATNQKVEVVQSLAKWKRMALYKYEIPLKQGIYTDMNAIRPSVSPSNTYSVYVDQWDWEVSISTEDRTQETLKVFVQKIYHVIQKTETYLITQYPQLSHKLPEDILFITSQELENMYPTMTPKERELQIVRLVKAVFIIGVGHQMKSGTKHAERAPDYDDWYLNGDIIFYHEPLDVALSISSMGIRVNKETLDLQLQLSDAEDRKQQDFYKMILHDLLPQSIGGGVGQSRLSMFLFEKVHIGEVQVSVWPDDVIKHCAINHIFLL